MQQESVNATITVLISGVPLEMRMTLPARPVKPSRMLPVFRAVADSFVEMGAEAAAARGETIACAKGCAACCRQIVPLAEAEVRALAELIEQMPEPRRSRVKADFAAGAERFRRTNWFERFEKSFQGSDKDVQELVVEYFKEKVACPFLEDESCSIYAQRPLACREYLVTSDPRHCFEMNVERLKPLNLLFKNSDVLCNLSGARTSDAIPFTPLIQLLERAAERPDCAPEKTGGEWATEFFGKLQKKAAQMQTG